MKFIVCENVGIISFKLEGSVFPLVLTGSAIFVADKPPLRFTYIRQKQARKKIGEGIGAERRSFGDSKNVEFASEEARIGCCDFGEV